MSFILWEGKGRVSHRGWQWGRQGMANGLATPTFISATPSLPPLLKKQGVARGSGVGKGQWGRKGEVGPF